MDPRTQFCHNAACPARGRIEEGNIGVHSRQDQRYKCHVCGKTFTATRGTVFYRLRTDAVIVTLVTTLLAWGCPVQAIVAAFGLDERTVRSWQTRAGEHCGRLHHHLVEQPRDLGQVQADEIRVKIQAGVIWLAQAMQITTRLWLGGALSAHRDTHLIVAVLRRVKASSLCRPMLFCVDGCRMYLTAIEIVFREPIRTGRRGRPRLRPWDNVCIAQVVKRYVRRRVVGIERRIAQGTPAQVTGLLAQTQGDVLSLSKGGGTINTAYIERLNATFRARIAALVRRGRALARQASTLQHAMYLVGTVYIFCTVHQSLPLPIYLPGDRRHWVHRTPAMAAGITDHPWTVHELLSYKIPLSPWRPPKRRGRPSRTTLALVERWCQ